jgi:hypothetical protein
MVRKARIKITIEGEVRPYTDGHWVVYDKDGRPTGFMHVERQHLKQTLPAVYEADPTKAFASFWHDVGDDPMAKALKGYRIGLVGERRFQELLAFHRGRKERKQK